MLALISRCGVTLHSLVIGNLLESRFHSLLRNMRPEVSNRIRSRAVIGKVRSTAAIIRSVRKGHMLPFTPVTPKASRTYRTIDQCRGGVLINSGIRWDIRGCNIWKLYAHQADFSATTRGKLPHRRRAPLQCVLLTRRASKRFRHAMPFQQARVVLYPWNVNESIVDTLHG